MIFKYVQVYEKVLLNMQIAGKFSAVRKAVLSVSGCLQDHSRGDAPNSTPIKSSGIALHVTGMAAQVDPFPLQVMHLDSRM